MRCRAVLLAFTACDSGRPPAGPPVPAVPRDASQMLDATVLDATLADPPAKRRAHGLDGFDLDGDGTADVIESTFSGGGHCCYSLAVTPSKSGKRVAFPFELDGGYVGGIDLGQPERLNIRDYDGDGAPEICAQIQTYNGERSTIPASWTKRYGIRTNVIEIRFATGDAVVRDHPGSCE